METQGFLSTEFSRKNILDAFAELGSQVEGLKDTANAILAKVYGNQNQVVCTHTHVYY